MRKASALSLPHRLRFTWRNPLPLTHLLDIDGLPGNPPRRNLAQVRPEPLEELWFTSSNPTRSPADDILNPPNAGPFNDHKPPDERTIKLGKTLRTLSPLLPNILNTPLPPNILSPNVSLLLFPSTHPHLPHRQRTSSLSRRSLDCPSRMGLCATRRQHQDPNSIREDRQIRLRHRPRLFK